MLLIISFRANNITKAFIIQNKEIKHSAKSLKILNWDIMNEVVSWDIGEAEKEITFPGDIIIRLQ